MSGPEDVTVREADGNDLQAVLEVGHRTWPQTYAPLAGEDYVAMGLKKWWTADAIIPLIRAGRVLVAEIDGAVAGMVATGSVGDHLVVWKLYVLPERQRRGAGAALLTAALERADGLYDEVRLPRLDGNEAARRFYVRHGFTDADREPGQGGIPDTVWMRRPLVRPDASTHDPAPDTTEED